MFIVLFDECGNVYDVECVGTKRTRNAALELMRSLVIDDCMECDEYESPECGEYVKSLSELIRSNASYMFSPKGGDGCYKVMEVPDMCESEE